MSEAIERMREELASRIIDQGVHWRILFIGRSVNGTTDIVSCLVRSLRNLGHHVLDLDLKKHRQLTDNPNKVTGGHGPVFVRLQAIEPLLDRFRPQMLVCGAGGLTFRPEDAEALKRRGIVLVGITLSDPDVLPSVHPHAHVFDFHTTNAHVALGMYRERGVNNTLYFPFGIDRGFVTQSVAPEPSLKADVICMGHATGRPERNALMSSLATRFDVKTYGRGWELQNSETVGGERMVQAMRMGRVHINFPLTRAGYINIKCGVFESVGSGALLCTGRFDEMADFFRYGEEILGYEDAEDLSRQLEGLLADPERYGRMTERAFKRLVDEHLYEHRWMALFETIYNVSPDSAPWLGEDRVAAIRATLAQSLPRAKKVIVAGFYGASNLGDELILRSIREGLERADPAVQVWVAAENPHNVERDHGLQAYARKQHHDSLYSARTAAAVVVGGGGLWHDYTFERAGGLVGLFRGAQISIAGFGILPLLGRMFELPYHVVGMGVGPLAHPDARRLVRFLAGHAESIYVRDEESAGLLRQSRVTEDKVRVAPDVVYALGLAEGGRAPEPVEALAREGYKLVGLNLRPWAKSDEDALLGRVAAALRELARDERIAVVGIPMQAGERLDVAVLQRVAAACGPEIPMHVLPSPPSFEGLCATLSRLQCLLSMRLHACLVAHRMRKPAVGIAYDPKVASHFAELGRSGLCLPIEAEAPRFVDALRQAFAEDGRLPGPAAQAVAGFEAEARIALAGAARSIAALPPRAAVYEVPGALDTPPAAPAVTPTTAAAATRPASGHAPVLARFVEARVSTEGIEAPAWKRGVLQGDRGELLVSLPSVRPRKGQRVTLNAELLLPVTDGLEIALLLESPYERARNLGAIGYALRVGGHVFAEDLAQSGEPVHLRLLSRDTVRLPVQLQLTVRRDCFESAAWPRVSQVKLSLLHAMPVPGVRTATAFVSRGTLSVPDGPGALPAVA